MSPTAIDRLVDVLGPLEPKTKAMLSSYLQNPTEPVWAQLYYVLISPTKTLWQAVTEVDPSFPAVSPPTPLRGRPKWDRWPDAFTTMRAIKHALDGSITES